MGDEPVWTAWAWGTVLSAEVVGGPATWFVMKGLPPGWSAAEVTSPRRRRPALFVALVGGAIPAIGVALSWLPRLPRRRRR